jgi:hypothetical protein
LIADLPGVLRLTRNGFLVAVACPAHPRGQCFEAPPRNLGAVPDVPEMQEGMPPCELCGRVDQPRAWANVNVSPEGKAMKSGCWCTRCEARTVEAHRMYGPGVTPTYAVRMP